MGKARALGALLLFSAIIVFVINVGLYSPPIINNYVPHWFWNPLSLLTSQIVGNIPIISGSLGWILNQFFGIILYPLILGFIGFILIK